MGYYRANLNSHYPAVLYWFTLTWFPAVIHSIWALAQDSSTYLDRCHRGKQTSATCSGRAGWAQHPWGPVSSVWQTAPRYRWGNWAWQRRCAEHRRTRSRCSWTSCRRIRRWRTPLGRTVSKLQGQQSARGHVSACFHFYSLELHHLRR